MDFTPDFSLIRVAADDRNKHALEKFLNTPEGWLTTQEKLMQSPVNLNGLKPFDADQGETYADVFNDQGYRVDPIKYFNKPGQWYVLLKDYIPTWAGSHLYGGKRGSLILFNEQGEVEDILDYVAPGHYDRGPAIGDLSENEQTSMGLFREEGIKIVPLTLDQIKRLVKHLVVTY